MTPTSLLGNIRVLDLSRVLSGPWATQMLADFGADVVKVERPGQGDDVRHQGARLKDRDGNETGEMTVFLAVNRGKRSIAIDMATPDGQALIRRLAAISDAAYDELLQWRTEAPNARLAHPAGSRHLDPLFVIAGAASLYEHGVGFPLRGFDHGTVSRRCIQFGR